MLLAQQRICKLKTPKDMSWPWQYNSIYFQHNSVIGIFNIKILLIIGIFNIFIRQAPLTQACDLFWPCILPYWTHYLICTKCHGFIGRCQEPSLFSKRTYCSARMENWLPHGLLSSAYLTLSYPSNQAGNKVTVNGCDTNTRARMNQINSLRHYHTGMT